MSSASTPLPGSSVTANISNGIPRYVQYTSPVSTTPLNPMGTGAALPLNIVAIIVSYLDDPGDLANVTRTCRLLYYMTLPSLYTKVSLRSHSEIRYRNGRPEGFGGGSPFLMALNGLVGGSHAAVVKELRLWGEWNEPGVEEFGRGRVPDNSVMLNIIARAAVDRMAQIETFLWQLDCKPLKTLYQGLAAHKTLTSLTLKFPNTRDPRPSVMIPPMANLRKFKATDIDPLCYPDDISMLLLGSKKLEDLRLHFSPRMRREAECSLNLDTYFGRCLRAEYSIPLKHLGFQNFYGPSTKVSEVPQAIRDPSGQADKCVGHGQDRKQRDHADHDSLGYVRWPWKQPRRHKKRLSRRHLGIHPAGLEDEFHVVSAEREITTAC